jgi:hypothetical protein
LGHSQAPGFLGNPHFENWIQFDGQCHGDLRVFLSDGDPGTTCPTTRLTDEAAGQKGSGDFVEHRADALADGLDGSRTLDLA